LLANYGSICQDIRGEVTHMRRKARKATSSLDAGVLATLDEVMAQGMAPGKNAPVEQASNKELRELQRQARQRRWQEGAKDTLLLKDVEDVETAFRCRTDIIPIA